jgi:hypothetical protein
LLARDGGAQRAPRHGGPAAATLARALATAFLNSVFAMGGLLLLN